MKKQIIAYAALLAVSLSACATNASDNAADVPEIHNETEQGETYENPLMVMVNGIVYCDTGRRSELLRCGMMDGEIASSVERSEEPSEDNQSNFGSGYSYQYGPEGTIEVLYEDEWRIFEQRDELIWYEGTAYQKSSLSPETLEWLAWYTSLTREEQLALSIVPEQLIQDDLQKDENSTD